MLLAAASAWEELCTERPWLWVPPSCRSGDSSLDGLSRLLATTARGTLGQASA